MNTPDKDSWGKTPNGDVDLPAGRTSISRPVLGASIALGVVGLAVGIGIYVFLHQPEAPERELVHVTPPVDPSTGTDETWSDFASLMNVGKAHLENGYPENAIQVTTAALKLAPDSGPALRNLARAYMMVDKPEQAREALTRAQRSDPDSVAVGYLLGLSLKRQSRVEEAIPHFEEAARRDPFTSNLRYQLAQAYNAVQQDDKAVEQLAETVRLDPFHSAAFYQLAMHARKTGDTEQFAERIREFQRLRKILGDRYQTRYASESCTYTEAEPAGGSPVKTDRKAPVQQIDVRLVEATDALLDTTHGELAATTIAVVDIDEDGRYTYLVSAPDGRLDLLSLGEGGRLRRTPLPWTAKEAGQFDRCIVGSFHDGHADDEYKRGAPDRLVDVFLIGQRGCLLLRQTAPGAFQDVTESAGLADVSGKAALWIDYEHDGDLDLLIAAPDGLQIRQNNGRGTFVDVTAEAGIPTDLVCTDVAAVDLELDGVVDIIAARGQRPTLVFKNQRAGRFARMPEPPGPWPVADHLYLDDLNNDAHADALLLGPQGATIFFGQTAHRQRIELAGMTPRAGALIDYDNDGWLDFCAVGHPSGQSDRGHVRIWRNGGIGPWSDVTRLLGLDALKLPSLRDAMAADVDNDGDTDLVLTADTAPLCVLRNDGGHLAGQLKLRLASLVTSSGAIGTHLELRRGEFWVTRSIQQELPIEVGLGGQRNLDTIHTFWPNGTIDNRVKVTPTDKPLEIVVFKMTEVGSCPFLYVWDGRTFRFVSDVLGSAGVNFATSRGVAAEPNPREYTRMGSAGQIRPRDGHFDVRITNELREVTYVDHVRLVAVDHSPEVEVYSTDKYHPPPFGESSVWTVGRPILLREVRSSDGIDRTEALRSMDGRFAPPGAKLPLPLRAVRRPLSLILEFGPLPTDRPLVLALTGWVYFGDSSATIAMSQYGSIETTWPRLEAETADGRWHVVDENIGLPSGKTKTILCDLADKLPSDARRLRLTTTCEVRWDRIALYSRRPLAAENIHQLPPSNASLHWRGFSDLVARAPEHPATPDYDRVVQTPAWYTALQGWCTRYGDIDELLADSDRRLAILNAGDELVLQFPAAELPPVPIGSTRTFLLYCVGWLREGDPNSVGGAAVAPLPPLIGESVVRTHRGGERWRLKFNTRWVPWDRFKSGWR